MSSVSLERDAVFVAPQLNFETRDMFTGPEISLELEARRRVESSEPLLVLPLVLGNLPISIRSRSSSLCMANQMDYCERHLNYFNYVVIRLKKIPIYNFCYLTVTIITSLINSYFFKPKGFFIDFLKTGFIIFKTLKKYNGVSKSYYLTNF